MSRKRCRKVYLNVLSSQRCILSTLLLRFHSFLKHTFFIFFTKVDGALWDLERPLEKSCKLELLDFEHPEGMVDVLSGRKKKCSLLAYIGKKVFWHSSAHVLGEAAERHYGCHLCLGPPTDDGFFYEMAIEER